MSDMVTIASGAHARHDPPYQLDDGRVVDVLDRAVRVDALLRGARRMGGALLGPDPIRAEDLSGVHTPGLIAFLESAWERWRDEGLPPPMFPDSFGPRWHCRPPEGTASVRLQAGYYCRDTCTPIVEETWAAALESAAVARTGAKLVCEGTRLAYALCRPPGHHAARDEFSGFCYLNNAALAAHDLRVMGRVAVIDLDFHHGNGTQDIFWSDPDVFYLSLHGDPDHGFPFFSGRADERGGAGAEGTVRNVPLADGTTGEAYLGALGTALEEVSAFGPATLVISLGLDVAASDPVGTFRLHDRHLAEAGRLLSGLGVPAVVVQEGGYDVPRLDGQISAFLTGLSDA